MDVAGYEQFLASLWEGESVAILDVFLVGTVLMSGRRWEVTVVMSRRGGGRSDGDRLSFERRGDVDTLFLFPGVFTDFCYSRPLFRARHLPVSIPKLVYEPFSTRSSTERDRNNHLPRVSWKRMNLRK